MNDDIGSIEVQQRGALLFMGLDRPHKLNGLTPEMADGLVDAYTQLEEDDALRVGVLYGKGERGFTAGLDLPRWDERMRSGSLMDRKGGVDPFNLGRGATKPIVTAVHGITYTAGIELMLAGDITIAADDCRFSQLEPKRGIMATGGATFRFIERGGWGNGMYHLLLSDEFDAQEALRCGLVQEVVPAGMQLARAEELATRIAELAPLAVQATKASALCWLREGERACIGGLAETQRRLARTEDAAEGVRSFQERREGRFLGR